MKNIWCEIGCPYMQFNKKDAYCMLYCAALVFDGILYIKADGCDDESCK